MIEGTIEDIAFGGDGVLKKDGFVVFVPFAAQGDCLEIALTQKKKSHGFGKILSIKSPGPSRIEPNCSLYGTCGGCQLQHIDYPAQLEIKRKFVEDSFHRIGKIFHPIPPVKPSSQQWSYRRHITLRLAKTEDGFRAGYIAADGKTHLPIASCPLFNSFDDPILSHLQEIVRQFSADGIEEAGVRIFKTKAQEYLLAFTFSPHLPANCENVLKGALEKQKSIDALFAQSPSESLSLGKTDPTFSMSGLELYYSPFGFLQNHAEQSEKIYQEILQTISPSSKKVLDLYCGIGITTLLLARSGRQAVGIESHPDSIRLAKKNAEMNQISAGFQEGKVELLLPSLLKEFSPDTILLNPPRTGLCPTLLPILSSSGIKEIFYVSCMPPTLARDLKGFYENYQIEHIQLFDMFPQTTHVETLIRLTLR